MLSIENSENNRTHKARFPNWSVKTSIVAGAKNVGQNENDHEDIVIPLKEVEN
jgi:hypothetical protein